MNCPLCRALSAVAPRKGSGRSLPFRVFAQLPIPDDVLVPSCHRCGAVCWNDQTSQAMVPVLEALYVDRLRHMVSAAIETLEIEVPQNWLECALGMSQGYLSRLKARDGNPSAQLVALLCLVAESPKETLHTIQDRWEAGERTETWTHRAQNEASLPTRRSRNRAKALLDSPRKNAVRSPPLGAEKPIASDSPTSGLRTQLGSPASSAVPRPHKTEPTWPRSAPKAGGRRKAGESQSAPTSQQLFARMGLRKKELTTLLGLSRRTLLMKQPCARKPIFGLAFLLGEHPELVEELAHFWALVDRSSLLE